MTATQTATGRPSQPLPLLQQALMLLLAVVVAMEAPQHLPHDGLGVALIIKATAPARPFYRPVRQFVLAHPALALAAFGILTALALAAYRSGLKLWHNQLKSRLSGTHFSPESSAFPLKGFNLLEQIARRPKGHTFVGMQAGRGALGLRWKPFYVSQAQRSMHTHVLGKTGSGKTSSVIWPQVLQDALDGKGVLVIDAKGSDENIRTMKAIAAIAGRQSELRVFSLPAWNQPHLFSHRYNMVHVSPRRSADEDTSGGDVAAMAERVFSVLPLGDNAYYNTQAKQIFTNVCRLLHGMVDAESGQGLPFVIRDIAMCLKGIGAGEADPYAKALQYCRAGSKDKEAAGEIDNQVARLGADVHKCFSGVLGALDQFRSPLLNAYAPDIVFEDVLQQGQLVYVQLPGNLFKVQAPAVGKVMLMDVQQQGSLRQLFRASRSQKPFSVVVDEFYDFADLSIINSLNKLRDAHLHFTLAHQSIADLELVSKEFAVAVWDNTRTKLILNQDNPELCEKVSKSIGTHQIVEKTVRQQQGALFTSLTTGDASSKLVEAFRLHPNAIKSLAPAGQAYCYFGQEIVPISLGMLPRLEEDYPMARREQNDVPGLRLEEQFLKRKAG
jgi:type IV secretory pathway TraG/TraD family ATPase VirD4